MARIDTDDESLLILSRLVNEICCRSIFVFYPSDLKYVLRIIKAVAEGKGLSHEIYDEACVDLHYRNMSEQVYKYHMNKLNCGDRIIVEMQEPYINSYYPPNARDSESRYYFVASDRIALLTRTIRGVLYILASVNNADQIAVHPSTATRRYLDNVETVYIHTGKLRKVDLDIDIDNPEIRSMFQARNGKLYLKGISIHISIPAPDDKSITPIHTQQT